MTPTWYSVDLDRDLRRWSLPSLIGGIALLAISCIGLLANPGQFYRSYLMGYLFWIGLALGSMAVSVGFMSAGKKHEALFVGQWAAPFLLLGIYNKMVKQHGSDAARESEGYTAAA